MTNPPQGALAAAASAASDLPGLDRVLAIANDKGGVGKTSITANLSALYATAEYRVLAIDINRQANLSDDLGYRGSEIDDQGDSLYLALRKGEPLTPRPVPGRPGLDVVPGGVELSDLPDLVNSLIRREGSGWQLALARSLSPIAGGYDLVLIDTPPENTHLIDLALGAARWLLMPTRTDAGGLVGMQLLAERFMKAHQVNPALSLLGVVLFGTSRTATAIHATVRDAVETAFGLPSSPMLTALIGHSERIANQGRARGRVAHELESDAANQPAWWQSLRDGERVRGRIPSTARNVAEDYRNLANEVLDLIVAAEKRADEGEGVAGE